MNPSSRHRIFCCTLEVRGVARSQVDAWRRRTRELWSRELAPVLESACNATFPGETRRIRQLEVEVAWRPGEGEPGLAQAFGRALKEQLSDLTRLGAASSHPPPLPQAPGGTLKVPAAGLQAPAVGSSQPGDSPEVGHPEEWLELWIRTGLLPWWARGTETFHIGDQLMERLRTAAGTAWFREILKSSPAAIRRVAFQFDDSWHQAALRAVWPAGTFLLEPLLALARKPGVASQPLDRAGVWADAWQLWSRRIAWSADLERAAAAVQACETAALEQFRTTLAIAAGRVPGQGGVATSAAMNQTGGFPGADLEDTCWRLWAEIERPSPELRGLARAAARTRDVAALEQFRDALLQALGSDAPGRTGPSTETVPAQTPVATGDRRGIHRQEPDGEAELTRLASECWRLWAELGNPPQDLVAAAHEAERRKDAPSLRRFHQALVARMHGGETPMPPATTDAEGSQTNPMDAAGSPAAARAQGESEAASTPGEPNVAADALELVCSPGLPLANAGLVLIAPFLPAFFGALDIHPSEASREQGTSASAPLLLHWLATGQDTAAEHSLPLPKLLCGLPLDEPVVCQQEFSESLIAEAGRLLASVVEHWGALGQTSTQGLREAFLQRPGVLRDAGPQWLLRVEHRAWDVLLDRVPWTFRTIRLPWMPRPLMVEWEAYA